MLLHNFQEPYQVIDTFGENDFVGVVLFNNNVCSWLLQELQGAVAI